MSKSFRFPGGPGPAYGGCPSSWQPGPAVAGGLGRVEHEAEVRKPAGNVVDRYTAASWSASFGEGSGGHGQGSVRREGWAGRRHNGRPDPSWCRLGDTRDKP